MNDICIFVLIPTRVLSWLISWNYDRASKLANFLDDKERNDEPVDHVN